MKLTVSAPGKINLMGEHSVVYGKPSLLAAIGGRRLYVTIETRVDKRMEIKTEADPALILEAIRIFKERFKLAKIPGLTITINSNIPTGCHLGSSAAISVATLGALMKFVKNLWNPTLINELAYRAEKKQHGNPSGGDNTVVTFGGIVWYRKEFEFLKSIWSLPTASYHFPQFLLINTGRPKESTGEMVGLVKSLYEKKPKYVKELLDDQEIQTKNILLALRNKEIKLLKIAVQIGERNLEKLGVVSEFVKGIIRQIEKNGGVAKVCGGGGVKGGTGILMCYHDDINVLLKFAQENKLDYFPAKLGEEGVRIEQNYKKS